MKAWTNRTASAEHSKDLRRDLSMDILLGGLIVVGDQVGDFLYGAMLEQQRDAQAKRTTRFTARSITFTSGTGSI
jgi:hypothetical protein